MQTGGRSPLFARSIDSSSIDMTLPYSRWLGSFRFLLTRKLRNALAPRRQFRFFNDHVGKTVLDGEFQPAALADQGIAFQRQPRMAGVEGAAEDVEKLGTDHAMETLLFGGRDQTTGAA